ncbi:Tautomerase enzyme [anaerobic digester metagenome]
MPVVTIQMSSGKSLEQKRQIVEEFTDTLVRTLKVDPSMITILIQELSRENIGKTGSLLSES